uniref:SET domain-containing protein n=1 Tax=Chromera velia CCMP2878 TaxID=1169474 RepID=A0A0G4H145_9ALVE|eukprot:Cvel_5540.t1-p1 / transcript=Cvel_5540.t1 / gene=Cvel_5540 / organism=Chromera_velia_CCMP2878 / gene_product=hypothetical protein / transcript_product=hypothetical protein / location=Cvel_scaffold259:90164-95260(+) / protein_length=822 / sequence_SO=supercontig / SO=protein_coding / is_pseudo=false
MLPIPVNTDALKKDRVPFCLRHIESFFRDLRGDFEFQFSESGDPLFDFRWCSAQEAYRESVIARKLVDAFRVCFLSDQDLCVCEGLAYGEEGTDKSHFAFESESNERKGLFAVRNALSAWISSQQDEVKEKGEGAKSSSSSASAGTTNGQTAGEEAEQTLCTARRLLTEVESMIGSFCAPANVPLCLPSAGDDPSSSAKEKEKEEAERVTEFLREVGSPPVVGPFTLSAGAGRGLQSLAAIPIGAPVFSLPESATLSVYSALESEEFGQAAVFLLHPESREVVVRGCLKEGSKGGNRYFETDGEERETAWRRSASRHVAEMGEVDSDTVLLLYLLHLRRVGVPTGSERGGGKGNGFDLLLKFFPERQESLLNGPPEVLEFLGNVEVTARIEDQLEKLFQLFCNLFPALPILFPDIFAYLDHFNWETFLWAKLIVETRGMALEVSPPPRFPEWTSSSSSSASRKGGDEKPSEEEEEEEEEEGLEFFPSLCKVSHEKLRGERLSVRIPHWAGAEGHVSVSLPLRVTVLVPVADLMNHSFRAQCGVPKFNRNSRRVEILCEGGVSGPGVEVFLSYGPLQSWEGLSHYGFCPRGETAPGSLPSSSSSSCSSSASASSSSSSSTAAPLKEIFGGINLSLVNLNDSLALVIEPPDGDPTEELKTALLDHLEIPRLHFLRAGIPRLSPFLLRCVRMALHGDIVGAVNRVESEGEGNGEEGGGAGGGLQALLSEPSQDWHHEGVCLEALSTIVKGLRTASDGRIRALQEIERRPVWDQPIWYGRWSSDLFACLRSSAAIVTAAEAELSRLKAVCEANSMTPPDADLDETM